MQEIIYTCIDEFDVAHYGRIDAESLADAREKILEEYGSDAVVEHWYSCRNTAENKFSPFQLDSYYLWKRNRNELVYAGPRLFLCARIFFSLLAVGLLTENIITGSLLALLVLLTFFISRRIIIRKDCVIYKHKSFGRKTEKKLDISGADKVLFKGMEFEYCTGRFCKMFFVLLEKDGREIIIYGHFDINRRSAEKMAKRIGRFLDLPVEQAVTAIKS